MTPPTIFTGTGARGNRGVRVGGLNTNLGVNTGAAPSELPALAGALEVDRDALLEAFLARLPAALEALDDDHAWEGTLEVLRQRSATLGREVTLEGVRGQAVAMDGEGALVLETADGPRRFLSGDVAVLLSSS